MGDRLLNNLSIVLVFWTVACLIFGGILWALMPRLDRRPKISVRCRKCWYDLRACVFDRCPECGVDLHKNGVWPKGKPNRRRLLAFTIPCFYVCNLLAIVGSMAWGESKSHIARHVTIDKSAVFVLHPQSEAFHGASFTVNGKGWDLFPSDQYSLSNLEARYVSLHIYADRKTFQAVTIDPTSRQVVRHTFPDINDEEEAIREASGINLEYGDILTSELLGVSVLQSSLTDEQIAQVVEEMEYLIHVAELCAERITLSDSHSDADEVSQIISNELNKNGLFGESFSFHKPVFDFDTKLLSDWLMVIPSVFGVALFLMLFYVIRRLCYTRDIVSWESVRSNLSTSDAEEMA